MRSRFVQMAALLLVVMGVPASSQQFYARSLVFETDGQSMWGPRTDPSLSISAFAGYTFPDFGPASLGFWTIAATAGLTGAQAGIQLSATEDPGSVHVRMPILAQLSFPDQANPGDTVSVDTGYSVNPRARLQTDSGGASFSIDAVFDAMAQVDLYHHDELIDSLNMPDGGPVPVSISHTLVSANSSDWESASFGNLKLKYRFPNIKTSGFYTDSTGTITSQGQASAVKVRGDLTDAISELMSEGLIELPIDLAASGSVSVPGFDQPWKWDYKILDVGLNYDFGIQQTFTFTPTPMVHFDSSAGDSIDVPLGSSASFTMPDSGALRITPTFYLSNTFSPSYQVTVAGAVDYTLLSAHLGGIPLIANLDFDSGTVKDPSFSLVLPVTIDAGTWQLGGFPSFTESTFTIHHN